jgi:hypothetical protein
MQALTDYIAPFHLTTLVRGSHPLWLGAGDHGSGMALFVSALDAEIYRHALIAGEGNPGWRRVPLADFDLRQMVRNHGGRFDGSIVFGFGATTSGQLATRGSVVRTRIVPLWRDPNPDGAEATGFHFPDWCFDFIQKQWTGIGAECHAEEVAATNLEKDSRIMTRAALALALERIVRAESHGPSERWCVYSPQAGKWRTGPSDPGQAVGSFSLSGSGLSETLHNAL